MASAATEHLGERVRRSLPVSPTEAQRKKIVKVSALLEKAAPTGRRSTPNCGLVGPDGETIKVPPALFAVLARVAEVLASGDAVTVVPVGQQLTTQQAASILNISRQYLVRLLESGKIPFTKTGKHRRLAIEDVLEYKEKRDKKRRKSLRKLTRLTQKYGGYPELK